MAQSSGLPAASLDVIKLAAPLLFTPLFNWTLYGVLCAQIYVYSLNFPIDGRSVKFLAYFVFLLETVQTALSGADIYYWFVAGFGNVERLGNHSHFAPVDVPIITSVTSLIVQGYFCYRIWVLIEQSSYRWICWTIVVAAVTQAVAGTWSGIKPLTDGTFEAGKTTPYIWSISSALADILIMVAMTLLLRTAGGKFSRFVLVRVVRLTIETTALTASLAITSVVLYVAFPNDLYYVYPAGIMGKVYSNTLLVSLNNRIYFRDQLSLEHGNIANILAPDGARATTLTPLSFAIPGPQPRALKTDIFPHLDITWQAGLVGSRGDDASTDSPLARPRECHLLPGDPERTVGMSFHPHDRKDEVVRAPV